ncbi:5'-nucleotidase [Nocardioides aurantiacus]|uniref:5'-nucleotidase n=1 Tax=Nocardioides aurantiacus TaxID=86796 RepID=UPI001FE61AC7|nr:5'-nucleotidase [Nocardioides aurantiacus]
MIGTAAYPSVPETLRGLPSRGPRGRVRLHARGCTGRTRRSDEPDYTPRLRIALVTARNASAHECAVHSLREWGVRVDDAFFLGGIEKARVLRVMQPHIYFDDQDLHLTGALEDVVAVHIPYGVANEASP